MRSKRSRYNVLVPRNVARSLKRFPLDERQALFQAIAALAEKPCPPGAARLRVKDLGEYRIRVGGFHIRYDIDDGARTVSILAVKPRGQAYRI